MQEETFVVGKSSFWSDSDSLKLSPKLRELLLKDSLSIEHSDVKQIVIFGEKSHYRKHEIKQLIDKMSSTRIKSLSLLNIKDMSCISSFLHIRYECLTRLELMNCNIVNVEALPWMLAEGIITLNLSQNHIVNLKPLKKSKWNQLKVIELGMTQTVKSLDCLTRLNSENSQHNQKLKKQLYFFFNVSCSTQFLLENVSFLGKLPKDSLDFTGLRVRKEGLIYQQGVQRAISRKQAR